MNEISDVHIDRAVEVVRILSDEIGPRPPCSLNERAAGDLIEAELSVSGLTPRREWFSSTRSFGTTYSLILGMALASGCLERRSRKLASLLGLSAAALGALEARFSPRSPMRLLRRSRSSNVFACIEPSDGASGTVCLLSHMDSSRSGLIFHPRATPYLGSIVEAVGIAVAVNALAPLLGVRKEGRALLAGVRLLLLAAVVLLLEREVRGVDVAGANDNASGVGACLALAAHFAEVPLANTRCVVLVTGSEESGVFGIRDFLERHDTQGWGFINFDGVGAEARLGVLSSEGGPISGVPADRDLLESALKVGQEYPELAAEPLAGGSGLPYDSTPVLASGGQAISIVNQDGAIPNYHWPSDVFAEFSGAAFSKAVRFAARFVERLDPGSGAGRSGDPG
jgi:hypothetical protein